MKLYKDNVEKEIGSQKVIARLLKDGWTTEHIAPVVELEITQPKKRGRPAKKEE